MRLIGVDPGLIRTGYGIIDYTDGVSSLVEAGFVATESALPISERLHKISDAINSACRDFSPEVMVLEKIFAHVKHPTTAILMGHARGVICLAAAQNNIPLVNLPSTRVKKAVLGHGHANKAQVSEAVFRILNLKQKKAPADVTDALAVAIAYAETELQRGIQI